MNQSDTQEPQTEIMKKFGMCDSDFTRFLGLCGLIEGQEELLPDWVESVAEKGLLKNGKYAILREACEDLIYNDNRIPLMSKTLDMIVKKAWGERGFHHSRSGPAGTHTLHHGP